MNGMTTLRVERVEEGRVPRDYLSFMRGKVINSMNNAARSNRDRCEI